MRNEKTKLVPKLRFPEFRGAALRSVLLGDVTEEGRRRNAKKHSVASVMGVTKADGIVPMEARLIAADIERYKLVEHEWFAYNPMRLNIGSIARWQGQGEILVSPDYVVFKCITDDESGIASGYLNQFLQTKAWEDFVTEGGDGGVRVRIYYKDIARLQLELPSLPEQQRVAECLSSMDELIAAQGRKVEALKTHKKGLMQWLFPREGETQPRLRFPEFQNANEWVVKALEAIAPLQRGFDLPSDEIRPGSVPVVYSNGPKGFHERGMAKGPGLVTGRSGTLGKLHFVESENYWPHNTSLWVTSFKGHHPKFVYYLYESIGFLRFASGSGVPTLNRNDAHSFETSVPPGSAEQQRTASCLSSLDTLITAAAQELDTLKTHKKGLIQQLFPSAEALEL